VQFSENNSPHGQKGYAVKNTVAATEDAGQREPHFLGLLDQLVRKGAEQMLAAALEAEVQQVLDHYKHLRDGHGRRQVVRNGRLPEREVLTGAGPVPVTQPRVRDKRGKDHPEAVRFTSSILPPYLRRSTSVDELIPWLYLRGVSTGDFQSALQALLGPDAPALSPSVISRLMKGWAAEYEAWNQRSLEGKEYVYLWADGVYFNIRLEGGRQCLLVVIGATPDGNKELVGILDGERESKQSWYELLTDLKRRGLNTPPKLATADGACGFWAALEEVFPDTRGQRCWVHKTANVLNKLQKSVQPAAKSDLHQVWMAPTRAAAHKAFDTFVAKYEPKYPKAVECLEKDRQALLTFYDFPAEHWVHLRTTNPVESAFATVRHRHRRTKGSGTRVASLAMVFKLMEAAERNWRKLTAAGRIHQLLAGHTFKDGEIQPRTAA
jgi:putative transposase